MIPTSRIAHRRLLIFLVPSLVLALLPGCDGLFGQPGRHIDRSISRSELLGPWSATASSIERLKRLGYRDHVGADDHRFELRENGSCRFQSFPHYAGPDAVVEVAGQIPLPGYMSVEAGCSWRLVSDRIYWLNRERQVPVVEFQMSSRRAPIMMSVRFYIDERDGRLLLWDYIGDPQEERYIDFVRE